MKRLILLLILAMMLTGCNHSSPTEPPETDPVVQIRPTDPAPSTEPSTLPATESTAPTETEEATVPTESSEPAETIFPSYTVTVSDPEKFYHEGPGFRYPVAGMFGELGIFTIVEECRDSDGNLWGRLKSGAGWVCLTDPAKVPVAVDYAPEHFQYDHSWHCGETEFVTDIAILPTEEITHVKVTMLNAIENYRTEEVLWEIEALDGQEAVMVSVVYWGDMTTYGLSFYDANGIQRFYAMYISGKDGSLICSEYTP